MSVVDSRATPVKLSGGSPFFASPLEWGHPRKRPNLENGGIRLPFTGEGLCSFALPRTFSACKAVTLGDAGDGNQSDPKKIIGKLHVNWGHASAQQIKRVLVDAGGDNLSLLRHVEQVVSQCDVCKAFEKAPRTPIAGTPTVAMFNEKLQVDLLLLDDLIVLLTMGVFSKYSVLTPVRSKNPLEVWDAFVACWIGIFAPPKAIQMDEGGEWKNEAWADFCADRRIKLFFQCVGAHPWILERRNGLARGIYNRMMADDRFSG